MVYNFFGRKTSVEQLKMAISQKKTKKKQTNKQTKKKKKVKNYVNQLSKNLRKVKYTFYRQFLGADLADMLMNYNYQCFD